MSVGTQRRYPVTMICAMWRVPRSTVYACRQRLERPRLVLRKRGPRTLVSDAVLLTAIRTVLAASPFHTEGHRKVRARFTAAGHLRGEGACPAIDAAAPVAGAVPPTASPWGSGTPRPDHHAATG